MGPTWPFLLMYGSHGMRHIGFPQVNGGQRDPRDRGVSRVVNRPSSFGASHFLSTITFNNSSNVIDSIKLNQTNAFPIKPSLGRNLQPL